MSENPDRFVADLARALPDALIALDVDGTLAPIVARPEDAVAVAGAADALRALAGAGARVGLLTGRPVEQALGIVGLDDGDSIAVLGHYGVQRWEAGRVQSPPVAPGVEVARRELPRLLRAAPAGVRVEDKEHALVVHARQTDDPAAALAALEPSLAELAQRTGLELLQGRAVLELRPPSGDKGGALTELVERAAARFVVYVGDDVADLAAFSALRDIGTAGRRVLAVASIDPNLQDTDPRLAAEADLVLSGPSAVVEWLRVIVRAQN